MSPLRKTNLTEFPLVITHARRPPRVGLGALTLTTIMREVYARRPGSASGISGENYREMDDA